MDCGLEAVENTHSHSLQTVNLSWQGNMACGLEDGENTHSHSLQTVDLSWQGNMDCGLEGGENTHNHSLQTVDFRRQWIAQHHSLQTVSLGCRTQCGGKRVGLLARWRADALPRRHLGQSLHTLSRLRALLLPHRRQPSCLHESHDITSRATVSRLLRQRKLGWR